MKHILILAVIFAATPARADSAKRKYVTLYDGVKIHYQEAGSGETLLLFHGFASWSYTWDDVMPELASRYHVLAPDFMGYGLSDKPKGANYGWDKYVRQMKEFLELKGVSKVHLIGSSLGGGVAIKFVNKYPDTVDRLVLIDSVGAGGNMEKKKKYFEAMLHPMIEKLVNTRLTVKAFLKNIFFYDKSLVSEKRVDMYHLPFKTPGAMNASWELIRAISPTFPLEELRNIKSPTLIVWGRNDKLAPVAEAEVFKEHIPNSALEIIESCGHLPAEEQPGELMPLLADFLAAR